MRLTSDQVLIILGTASRLSGEDAEVYLFGSRLDDRARGGDVDLLIETPHGLTLLERARLQLELELEEGLGLPVDVVSRARDAEPTPFQRIARAGALRLEALL
jgi:predicted nucleotidyltransferase